MMPTQWSMFVILHILEYCYVSWFAPCLVCQHNVISCVTIFSCRGVSCMRFALCHHYAMESKVTPMTSNRLLHLWMIHMPACNWHEILCTRNCPFFICYSEGNKNKNTNSSKVWILVLSFFLSSSSYWISNGSFPLYILCVFFIHFYKAKVHFDPRLFLSRRRWCSSNIQKTKHDWSVSSE